MEVGRTNVFGPGLELARLLVGTSCKWKLEEDEDELFNQGLKVFLCDFLLIVEFRKAVQTRSNSISAGSSFGTLCNP